MFGLTDIAKVPLQMRNPEQQSRLLQADLRLHGAQRIEKLAVRESRQIFKGL